MDGCCFSLLLITLARTINVVLNWSGGFGHPCLATNVRGQDFNFYHWYGTGCEFLINNICRVELHFVYTCFLMVFIMKRCWVYSHAFSAAKERIMVFLYFILLMEASTSFYFWMWSHLFMANDSFIVQLTLLIFSLASFHLFSSKYRPVVFLWCHLFWLWYQDNAVFKKKFGNIPSSSVVLGGFVRNWY